MLINDFTIINMIDSHMAVAYSEDRVYRIICVKDLEVFIDQDDSLLQVIDQLFPGLLFLRPELQLLKVLLEDVVFLLLQVANISNKHYCYEENIYLSWVFDLIDKDENDEHRSPQADDFEISYR